MTVHCSTGLSNNHDPAGDPDSKNASDTAMLGSGDVGYTIPAEFNPKFFHKKEYWRQHARVMM